MLYPLQVSATRATQTALVASLRLGPPKARQTTVDVPGDKSISHRALLLSAVADGTTVVINPNRGADVMATLNALRRVGVRVSKRGDTFIVAGSHTLHDSQAPIDCGNSGTTMRLLMGLLAGRVNAKLDGDASLRRRPMERVAAPLRAMGANIKTSRRGKPPVTLQHAGKPLRGITYELPVASAQVKSALLLAGLQASGRTTLICRDQTRDHTERMLKLMGAAITVGSRRILLRPSALRSPARLYVPGDFSAAFYLMAAAAVMPGSQLRLRMVGVNVTRSAALDVLKAMGARVHITNRRERSGEPTADVVIKGGAPLRGVTVDKSLVPNLIDEIPALCAVAAAAKGAFRVCGAAELKLKESNRIATTVALLKSFVVDARSLPDGIIVRGGRSLHAPRSVATHGDHRIGMAAAILATARARRSSSRTRSASQRRFPVLPEFGAKRLGKSRKL